MISASFLSIKDNLEENLKVLESTNIDYIHVDIMDYDFVNNQTNNNKIIDILKSVNKPLDIHLMVNDLDKVIHDFINLKPEYITIHIEIDKDINKYIKLIKDNNIKVGLSIKPNTNIEALKPYLDIIDLVLVMTVEPGMGGQKLIKETILKVNKLNQIKDNYNFIVEVDGGINNINIKDIDADIYVVGSYITSGDYNKRVEELKEIINEKESK